MILSIVLLLALPLSAWCAGVEERVGMEGLYDASGAYLDGYVDARSVTGEDLAAGLGAILEGSGEETRGAASSALRRGVLLLTVSLLCGLARETRSAPEEGGLDPVRLCGALAVTTIAATDVNSLMALGRRTMEQMSAFGGALLPTVTAASAAAGLTAGSAARQSVTLLFLNLLLGLVDRFLLPLVYGYVALETAGWALGNEGLKRLGSFLKWGCAALLTILLTCFVFYLTLSGAVAGKADAIAQKAAKTALSGMVPVVGGVLSDAAETVVAGAGVLRGTVGVLGMLTVFAICVGPFLYLGFHYLAYRLASILSDTAAPGPVTGLIDALGSAFALLLGMVGGEALILYVALITSIQVVSG